MTPTPPPPTRVFSSAQCRAVDRIAIEAWGMSGLVLMENAGRGAAESILKLAGERARVAVLCGSGNNGGDGYVIARHLHNAGVPVRCWPTREPQASDARANHAVARQMGLVSDTPIEPGGLAEVERFAPTLIVDALLGTGVTGPARPPLPAVIAFVDRMRAALPALKVVAVDVPSGMDCDTGGGACVRADMTVTFVGWKRGFVTPRGREKTGPVEVVAIGVPRSVIESL